MHKLVKIAAAIALALDASQVSAAEITRTFDVVASDFTSPIVGAMGPEQHFAASYTLTFDPAVGVATTTAGLTVNALSLADGSEYAYSALVGSLAIGTDVVDPFDIATPPASYGLFIDAPASDQPYLVTVFYTTAAGDYYSSGMQSLTSAAPEPAGWALMLVGVATAGSALRLRRRNRQSAGV